MANFDGIEEHDNPLPMWWLWTFHLTVIFAVFYSLYYFVLGGPSLKSNFEGDLNKLKATQLELKLKNPKPTNEVFAALASEQTALSSGKNIYSVRCASCHGIDGGGSIGPNLTDNFWIQGKGDFISIYDVLYAGVLEKGMPAWNGILNENELKETTVYVASFKGKKAASPKPPQGTEIK
jgi:cytochrome c oxidase cbb3-type subunit 3